MSRVADSDLQELESFLESYRVPAALGAQARWALIKRAHRHVLAAVQIWQRFFELYQAESIILRFRPITPSPDNISHLAEYFSDITCAVSCLAHGLYKPSNVILRSSIENFVRGIAGLYSLEARETTSVYRLFELASEQEPFRGAAAGYFDALRQVYGDLCLYVHSATPDHRGGAHHISLHMRHDTSKMKAAVIALERINCAALNVLVLADGRLYTTSAPRVQDLLDDVLPKSVRLAALGGE